MTRSTSTQRGASRRNAGSTARSGQAARGASSRTRPSKKPSTSRSKTTAARTSKRAAGSTGPWVPLIVVGIVIVLAWALYPAIRLEYQASRDEATHQAELKTLSEGNKKLSAEVDALKTPKGVEKAARESLGYAKSGEHVYVVVPPTAEDSSAADLDVSQADVTGRSVVQVLLDALFGVQQPSNNVEP